MPARSATLSANPRVTDEKITINLGVVDLGQVDLLVQEGFYANRSDFIRTAIRNQIGSHQEVLKEVVARRTLVLGIQHFTAADLKAVQKARRMLDIRVLGLTSFADDITPELALATIRSLSVLGAWHARPALRAALAPRLR